MQNDSIDVPEEWRPVVGYEGIYSVSNLGRVRRDIGGRGVRKFYIFRGTKNSSGYPLVSLCRDGTIVQTKIHRVVLMAFVGPCPDGMEGCHNDGNASNNKLNNLRWDTPKNNHADMRKHGTQFRPRGELCGRSKLTPEDVHEIRALLKQNKLLQKEIGAMYGVNGAAIGKIHRRLRWQHLE